MNYRVNVRTEIETRTSVYTFQQLEELLGIERGTHIVAACQCGSGIEIRTATAVLKVSERETPSPEPQGSIAEGPAGGRVRGYTGI